MTNLKHLQPVMNELMRLYDTYKIDLYLWLIHDTPKHDVCDKIILRPICEGFISGPYICPSCGAVMNDSDDFSYGFGFFPKGKTP